LGVDDFVGTKADLFHKLSEEVDSILADWPPSLPNLQPQSENSTQQPNAQSNPAQQPVSVNQQMNFWTGLANSLTTAAPSANLPIFYPTVLLNLEKFQGSPQDLLDALVLETATLEQLKGQNLVNARPNLSRTFAELSKTPVPNALNVDVLKNAAMAFLLSKIKKLRQAILLRQQNAMQPPTQSVNLAQTTADQSGGPSQPINLVLPGAPAQTFHASQSTTAQRGGTAPPNNTDQPTVGQPHVPVINSQFQPSIVNVMPATASINTLAHNFSSLIGQLQQSGVTNISMTSPTPPPLPNYISNALDQPDSTLAVVPSRISDVDAQQDASILKRLKFLHSPLNIDQRIIHDDVERFIQDRFCAADMDILRLENSGGRYRRQDIIQQKSLVYQDVRRILEVRQQRYLLQKRKIGNALAKTEVEELKTREFSLFANVRLKLRALFATPAERRAAFASVTSKEDCTLVQAALSASPACSQAVLAMLHKSRFTKKRKPVSYGHHDNFGAAVSYGHHGNFGAEKSRIKITRYPTCACFHCGATGKNYHGYPKCPEWLKGVKPKTDTVHGKQLAKGEKIPVFRKP
jgi:hypothetical protein